MQLKPDTSVQSVKKFIVNVLSILAYKNTEPGISAPGVLLREIIVLNTYRRLRFLKALVLNRLP